MWSRHYHLYPFHEKELLRSGPTKPIPDNTHSYLLCALCSPLPTAGRLAIDPLHFVTRLWQCTSGSDSSLESLPIVHCSGLRSVDSYVPRTAERQYASLTCAQLAGEGLVRSSTDGRGLLPKQAQMTTPLKNTVTKIRMSSIAAQRGQRRKIDGVVSRADSTPIYTVVCGLAAKKLRVESPLKTSSRVLRYKKQPHVHNIVSYIAVCGHMQQVGDSCACLMPGGPL